MLRGLDQLMERKESRVFDVLRLKHCMKGNVGRPFCKLKLEKSSLVGSELVQETTDKVALIKEKLKATRDRQKSYVDNMRKHLEWKLKYLADTNLHMHLEEIKVDKTLRFVKEPVEIIDRKVKSLKRSGIPIVKSIGTRSELDEIQSMALSSRGNVRTIRKLSIPDYLLMMMLNQLVKSRDKISLRRRYYDNCALSSYACSDSLLLTPLCCDDIDDVTPRVSALPGCDREQCGTSTIPDHPVVDPLNLDVANRERTRLLLFQFCLRDQASNWLKRLPAGSISTWEDLTTRFLAQFFPPGRSAKLRNDILMFQQHQGTIESDSGEDIGRNIIVEVKKKAEEALDNSKIEVEEAEMKREESEEEIKEETKDEEEDDPKYFNTFPTIEELDFMIVGDISSIIDRKTVSERIWEITHRIACRIFFQKNKCEIFTVLGDDVGIKPDGVTSPDL
ncbi:zinc finger, CCHC-type containing protein [Tanacetum coccineum]